MDGGASRARAMLVCESDRLFTYLDLGLNPRLLSGREFGTRLENLIQPLLKQSRPRPRSISAIIALAGAGSKPMKTYCAKLARGVLARSGAKVRVRILGDVDVLVEALLKTTDGIALVAGTGSVCVGVRHEDGGVQKVRVGGWGSLFDFGCGFRAGQAALRQALWEIDGGRPSALTLMLLDHYGCKARDLAQAASGWEIRKIAEAAMVVAKGYSLGSPVARRIWRKTAAEIADLIAATHARIRLRGQFPVYATGGLFRDRHLVRLVRGKLRRILPGASLKVVREPMLKLIYELAA